jgi:hypothetical protein
MKNFKFKLAMVIFRIQSWIDTPLIKLQGYLFELDELSSEENKQVDEALDKFIKDLEK